MWLMDGSAINRVAREAVDYNRIFAALTDMVAAGELSFCDHVVHELDRTGEGGTGLLWARTVKGQRQHKGASYAVQRWVIHNVAELVDLDDLVDAAAQVIAQAKAIVDDGTQATLVTDDVVEKPTRRALSDVCDELAIPWVDVPVMMASCAIPWP